MKDRLADRLESDKKITDTVEAYYRILAERRRGELCFIDASMDAEQVLSAAVEAIEKEYR